MSEPELPGQFPAAIISAIRRRLDVARASGVSIAFAIESGSRAWGFPSPDSDFDCRFVYVRPSADHLALTLHRDVIEFPVTTELDVGGWDLRKALKLALKGNAVIYEWVCSPIAYEESDGFRGRFAALLEEIIDPKAVAHHYLGLARTQFERNMLEAKDVKLKKLFYFVRPLVALRWMQERSFEQLPPMNLEQLLLESPLPRDITEELNALLVKKRQTREMGTGAAPQSMMRYFTGLYSDFSEQLPRRAISGATAADRFQRAQNYYNRVVGEFS